MWERDLSGEEMSLCHVFHFAVCIFQMWSMSCLIESCRCRVVRETLRPIHIYWVTCLAFCFNPKEENNNFLIIALPFLTSLVRASVIIIWRLSVININPRWNDLDVKSVLIWCLGFKFVYEKHFPKTAFGISLKHKYGHMTEVIHVRKNIILTSSVVLRHRFTR